MSEPDPPPPLDDDVRRLVQGAARIDAAPPGVRARVLARVEALVKPAFTSPEPGLAAPTRLARRLLPLAASFVAGGALGALVASNTMPHRVVPGPVRVVYVDRPVPAPAPAPVRPTADLSSAKSSPSSPNAASRNRLKAERRLLDVARGAIEREQPDVALRATVRHEHAFPTGILVQEREAIAIRALTMLGRSAEARDRATRFRTNFPDSALWPAIESIVGAPQKP